MQAPAVAGADAAAPASMTSSSSASAYHHLAFPRVEVWTPYNLVCGETVIAHTQAASQGKLFEHRRLNATKNTFERVVHVLYTDVQSHCPVNNAPEGWRSVSTGARVRWIEITDL